MVWLDWANGAKRIWNNHLDVGTPGANLLLIGVGEIIDWLW